MFNKLLDWLSGCVIVPSGHRGSGREQRRAEQRRQESRKGDFYNLNVKGSR